jgi:tetratricopeptide (TPR) repeat protein
MGITHKNLQKVIAVVTWLKCFVLFLCLNLPLMAQLPVKMLGYSADTIYSKLINANDHQRMKAWNQLAFYHSIYTPDSALFYAEKALQLAEKFEDENEKRNALRNTGNAYALAGNYRQAMINLHKALEIAEMRNDRRRMLELYLDIGKVNYDTEDYISSLKYVDLIMAILTDQQTDLRRIVSPVEEAIIYFMSGGAAREARELDRGVSYFKKYIEISKQYNFPDEMNRHAVKSLAETYSYAAEYDSALKYTYIARSYFPVNKNKDFDQHVGYEGSIGALLFRKGKFDEALTLLWFSYDKTKQSGTLYYTAAEAMTLGAVHFSLNQYDSALYWYNKAQSHADEFAIQLRHAEDESEKQNVYVGYQYMVNINDEEIMQRFYRMMRNLNARYTALFKATGNYAKALEHSELKSAYSDSLTSLTQKVEERKTQIRLETEKMEQQVDLLAADNALKQSRLRNNSLIFLSVILALLFALMLVYFFFRQRRIREMHEKIILEQRLLRSQMNPHFIFNSLSSVQNAILYNESDKAVKYLTRFGKLMRQILESSAVEKVSLAEEIVTIENYLALQQIRFPDKFDYKIDVDERIDIEEVFIPPMLTQPFLENAVEHGIRHKSTKGEITVKFEQQNGGMVIMIQDDGVGREKAEELRRQSNRDYKSMATAITKERIKVLNKKLKNKITLEIFDLKDENGEAIGTRVAFEVAV